MILQERFEIKIVDLKAMEIEFRSLDELLSLKVLVSFYGTSTEFIRKNFALDNEYELIIQKVKKGNEFDEDITNQ